MPDCENSLLPKLTSAATSTVSVSGRGPVLDAFSISRTTGCWPTEIFVETGSSVFGALISIPGIGPATDGLNGVVLLVASHPTTAKSSGTRQTGLSRFIILMNLEKPVAAQ